MTDTLDGRWIDSFGMCRTCGGEIPHGHILDCDVYSYQRQIDSFKAVIAAARDVCATEPCHCSHAQCPRRFLAQAVTAYDAITERTV